MLGVGFAPIPPLSKGGFLQAKTGGPYGLWPRLCLGGDGLGIRALSDTVLAGIKGLGLCAEVGVKRLGQAG